MNIRNVTNNENHNKNISFKYNFKLKETAILLKKR